MLTAVDHIEDELIPQAIIGKPLQDVLKPFPLVRVRKSEDDLDSYVGADLCIREFNLLFSLRRYEGYPPNTATIYLPRMYRDVGHITETVRTILRELKLRAADLEWERSLDPDL